MPLRHPKPYPDDFIVLLIRMLLLEPPKYMLLIPFEFAWPFYTPGGRPKIDIFFIKTILTVVSVLLAVFLLFMYFRNIDKNYLREGIIVGFVWLGINWVLDLLVLVPLS